MNASWLCGATSIFAPAENSLSLSDCSTASLFADSEKKFKSSTSTSSVVIRLVSATNLLGRALIIGLYVYVNVNSPTRHLTFVGLFCAELRKVPRVLLSA